MPRAISAGKFQSASFTMLSFVFEGRKTWNSIEAYNEQTRTWNLCFPDWDIKLCSFSNQIPIQLRSMHWNQPCFVQHSEKWFQLWLDITVIDIELAHSQGDESNTADSRPSFHSVDAEGLQSHHTGTSSDMSWTWSAHHITQRISGVF